MFEPCLAAATSLRMHFPTPALSGSGTKGLISASEEAPPSNLADGKERNESQIQSEVALLHKRGSWHRPTLPPRRAVPSALRDLTALFGMEEVYPPRYKHQEACRYICSNVLTGRIRRMINTQSADEL